MLSVSFWEILFIVFIAILVVKPADWPVLIRVLTRWYKTIRQMITSLQHTWQQTLDIEDSNQSQQSEKAKHTHSTSAKDNP